MEKIWNYMFDSLLKVTPEEHPVLLTECPMNPKINREKATQIMFETFKTPAFYLANQAVLSMYSTGRTSGIVLDSGYDITRVVQIYEGHALPHRHNLNLGGYHFLTPKIETKLLLSSSFSFSNYPKIKKESLLSQIALDMYRKMHFSPYEESTYELPDQNSVTFTNEDFSCPDILFNSLPHRNITGVHQMVHNAIMNCDVELRRGLYSSIILSGESTMLPGFVERLNKELSSIAPTPAAIKITAQPDRFNSVWVGGAIFSSLSTFPEKCIYKEQYEEAGPSIVHQMCF